MDKAQTFSLMGIFILENTKKENLMERVNTLGEMDRCMWENSRMG
jgi:hypothetical protein